MSNIPSDQAVEALLTELTAEDKRLLLAMLRQLVQDTEGCQ